MRNELMIFTLAAMLPLCSFATTGDDNTTATETQKIILSGENNTLDSETLKVPVTATLSNNVLNVQFTGTVPVATVSLSNAVTGATVAQQSMAAMSGSFCTVPVSSGTYVLNVTDEQSGESVSGVVDVEE